MRRFLPLLLLMAACTPDRSRQISASDFSSDSWPFTVSSGRLKCVEPSAIVFESNGVEYGINGTADATKRYQDIRSIWKDDPKLVGAKITLSPINQAGMKLCK